MGVALRMTYKIPKGYERDEDQEFKEKKEAYDLISKCKKCTEMKSKEKFSLNKELNERLKDGFSYWADAFVALKPTNLFLDRKVECSSFIKYKCHKF